MMCVARFLTTFFLLTTAVSSAGQQLWWVLDGPPGAVEGKLYIIDAHSQADQKVGLDEIVPLMNKAGVRRTILAMRDDRTAEELLGLAADHPDRIIPAVRLKGFGLSNGNQQKWTKALKRQLAMPDFGAMAEFLMWHREKPQHAVTTADGGTTAPPQVIYPPDHPVVKTALEAAIKRRWPFVAHIEFKATGERRGEFMSKFEGLLQDYPDHPFALIHMAELEIGDVRRLIETYPNIHFIPAHTDPHSVKISPLPFTRLFSGNTLAPEWKKLIVEHPDRFVMGFDNVWVHNWQSHYVKQVAHWRRALKSLPPEVAHLFAHGNAERLWRLR